MRKALVAKIDERKSIAYFRRTQGWSPAMTRAQVLTPLEESSLRGTIVDPKSIMCYQIPGTITKDGKPIIGGLDIDKEDYTFAATIYPKGPKTRKRPKPKKRRQQTRAKSKPKTRVKSKRKR
jgi:hypothetical protein